MPPLCSTIPLTSNTNDYKSATATVLVSGLSKQNTLYN
jgi:hypothetical protein